ncbi:hypothetical protein [Rhodanobacter sp. DHB23]|uniref:hypothetical protein n=1 Tax=Rhodanobacter sp. DHB23 TaxID=2775923 RepID=UPI00177BF8A6|nr:hypothetical protein [Rhodanobacter sp. DHB23]MBD8872964.1 hypothetical protein [Rhodanobacter sp. DHB23]
MNVSSIYGTRWQSANGLVASGYAQQQKQPAGSQAAPAARSNLSAENAGQMAAAIAAAMTQLGLTAAPGQPATGSATTQGDASPGSRQVRQYKDMAATFSSLARALDANAGGTPATASSSSGLTSVFQNLWATLGAASETSASASIPSLPTFLQSLASNFGESGISGLRGVFVDTVA